MRRFIVAVILTVFLLPLSGARAEELEPSGPSDTTRYTFHRTGDTFLRLDARTGQVSVCGWSALGWYCRVVPDERRALESEIGRLQDVNSALKKDLLARGLPLPDGIKSDPSDARDPVRSAGIPSDVRHMSLLDRVWLRVVQLVASVQRDMFGRS